MKEIKVKSLNSLAERTRGLIGVDKAEPVLIQTRFGIHTFGVRFSIDVLILDARCQVVVLKENLRPNRVFFWPIKYDTVIELPAGEIRRRKLQLGEKIELNSK